MHHWRLKDDTLSTLPTGARSLGQGTSTNDQQLASNYIDGLPARLEREAGPMLLYEGTCQLQRNQIGCTHNMTEPYRAQVHLMR